MSTRWPYETLGDPNTPPLIFLHGFLGSRQDWLPAARVFFQDHFCILPDLPGHGENENLPLDQPLSFHFLAEELKQFIVGLRIDRPVLVGYSLGGRTALNFACTYPELLRALVLESTSPGLAETKARAARAAVDDARADQIRTNGLPAFLQAWYNAGLWDSLASYPEKRSTLIENRGAGNANLLARAIAELSPGRMPSRWDVLPQIALPTLLLAGELDPKYTGILHKTAELIPGCQSAIVEDAGHNIHLERPEAFHQILSRFIRSLP